MLTSGDFCQLLPFLAKASATDESESPLSVTY